MGRRKAADRIVQHIETATRQVELAVAQKDTALAESIATLRETQHASARDAHTEGAELRARLDTLLGRLTDVQREVRGLHTRIEKMQAEAAERGPAGGCATGATCSCGIDSPTLVGDVRQPAVSATATEQAAVPAAREEKESHMLPEENVEVNAHTVEETPRVPVASPAPSLETHAKFLRTAAGIASATLICHRDTWSFLLEQTAGSRHFRVPGSIVEEGAGTVCVSLSGRSLIAALEEVLSLAEQGTDPGDRALARTLYDRMTAAVRTAVPWQRPVSHSTEEAADGQDERSGVPEQGTVVIVLDDRLPYVRTTNGRSGKADPPGAEA